MKLVPRNRKNSPTHERNVALASTSLGFGGVYTQPWDSKRAVVEGHARESLVSAITQAVAADVSDTGLFYFRAIQLGTGADVSDRTPLIYALNTAANQNMSAVEVRAHLSLALDYAGECYLVEVGDTITPILGGHVKVLQAARGQVNRDGSPALVAGYAIVSDNGEEIGRYDGEGRPVSGQAIGQLHRIHFPYPLDPWRADAPVARAGLPIDVVHYSRLATKSLLQNAGQPAGLVTVRDPNVSQESIDAFDRRINSRLSDVTQKGRTLVVSSDIEYTQLGNSNPGTGWADLSAQAREDVMAVWNIPESRLARGGARTYENQKTELSAYYRAVVLTRLNLIASVLSRSTRARGYYIEVDYSAVPELHESTDAVATRVVSLAMAGLVTVNEAREQLGLPPIPDGDRLPTTPATPNAGNEEQAPEARGAVPFETPAPAAGVGEVTTIDSRATRPTGTQPTDDEWNTAYDAVVDTHEGILAEIAQRYHARLYRNIVGALRRQVKTRAGGDNAPVPAGIEADDLIDVAGRNAELADDLVRPVGAAVRAVAAEAGSLLGAGSLANLSRFEIVAAQRVARLVTGTDPATGKRVFSGWTASLRDDVADALTISYREGESVGELAARIADTLGVDPANPRAVKERALTIARTEINGLANQVSYEAMEASGVVEGKAWYTIGDGRTRGSHFAAGQRYTRENPIPLSEKFDVGGVMMSGPHDTGAPASQVVNCRCRLLPVVRVS